jgi:hypothetical protein
MIRDADFAKSSVKSEEIHEAEEKNESLLKIPIRLHDKIRESSEPVVGLRFITEFSPVSDPEMEPHYECGLCGYEGGSNRMYSHIIGDGHRQMFVDNMSNYNHGTSLAKCAQHVCTAISLQ